MNLFATILGAAMTLTTCSAPVENLPVAERVQEETTTTTLAPPPENECEGFRAVLMQFYDPATLPCNPNGDQVLVSVIDDDPGSIQEETCQHKGGQVLYDPAVDRFYCIDIDY